MGKFKFNFLWRGQLENLSLDKSSNTVFKTFPYHEGLFGNLIFAIIARMFSGNHLNKNVIMLETFKSKRPLRLLNMFRRAIKLGL